MEPKTNGGYDHIYQYKDHLGNVRLSYKNAGTASNPDLEIQEENNYYPFGISYNEPQNGVVPLYNGNISETRWRTANADDSSLKYYTYDYDALNRITSGIDNTQDNRYSLTGISYDENGNIQNLERNGYTDVNVTTFGVMDNLTYSYTGNQLKAIDDAITASAVTGFVDGAELATEYTYDANGNLLTNANKGITSIIYNHLNLPTKITVNGNANDGTIDYVYDVTGTKLKKTISNGAETD
ncbi:hypothetical protein [Maribacter sp. 2-571]|uniref:hypothetical protein n=1 Tax=Maribacter sp. 2-571 TaxID=3417569 RepID=UPI003D35527C